MNVKDINWAYLLYAGRRISQSHTTVLKSTLITRHLREA